MDAFLSQLPYDIASTLSAPTNGFASYGKPSTPMGDSNIFTKTPAINESAQGSINRFITSYLMAVNAIDTFIPGEPLFVIKTNDTNDMYRLSQVYTLPEVNQILLKQHLSNSNPANSGVKRPRWGFNINEDDQTITEYNFTQRFFYAGICYFGREVVSVVNQMSKYSGTTPVTILCEGRMEIGNIWGRVEVGDSLGFVLKRVNSLKLDDPATRPTNLIEQATQNGPLQLLPISTFYKFSVRMDKNNTINSEYQLYSGERGIRYYFYNQDSNNVFNLVERRGLKIWMGKVLTAPMGSGPSREDCNAMVRGRSSTSDSDYTTEKYDENTVSLNAKQIRNTNKNIHDITIYAACKASFPVVDSSRLRYI